MRVTAAECVHNADSANPLEAHTTMLIRIQSIEKLELNSLLTSGDAALRDAAVNSARRPRAVGILAP